MRTPKTTPAMFPGWIGGFVDASAAYTEAHPACIGIHLLIGLGNLVGRSPHTLVGATRHACNEFAMVVGPTSIGRKGDGRNLAFAPLDRADEQWQVAAGLSSGEGVIHAVRDPVFGIDKKTGEAVLLDPGVDDKRLCIVESEASQMLKMFRREGNILSNVLRDAWDGNRPLRTLTKNSPVRATKAHISLVAHATQEDLRAYLSDLDIANGVANRFLFTAVQRLHELPEPLPLPKEVLAPLVGQVQAVVTAAQGIERMEWTPAARALWRDWYPKLTLDRPDLAGVLLARGPGHVTRLSTIFALLTPAPCVDVAHLESALAWWEYGRQSVGIIFGDRTGNATADRLRAEFLPGQEMSFDTIRREIFSGHVTDARLKDAVELLGALEGWSTRVEPTGGRPRLLLKRPEVAA
jgi:Protein of unknown function (DUF3987)